MHDYSEDALVERPAVALFGELGWETANCMYEFDRGPSPLGRETMAEVVLVARLRLAAQRLNPALPEAAIEQAVEEIVRDRGRMSLAAANREVYRLLKQGVIVRFRGDDGEEVSETVRVIDWKDPDNNDFFLVSQFWVQGEMYKRRADLVGFVNGLPLVFVELKAVHRELKHAYDDNLRDYKTAIPQLFWCNGVILLSNGSESRIGSLTATWEHFAEWKRINSEGETGIVSLETMLRGTCDRAKLLDLVENFTLFVETGGGDAGALVKIVGKNHQVLGVNNAIEALRAIRDNQGRLGVFWHTQGSGKSISMIFFAQKVLRTIPGNWTFVVVTDRQELDGQIYGNFANAGAVTEAEAQADSGEDLKRLLGEDHRYVFTLIQKFRTEEGQPFPMVSDRSDIVVMTDEAHRSQYDTFALNMRTALPNAAFIGFTGTPLMAGEEKTREVFGEYVSIYDFRQSQEDGATVPLYYENRVPELQLTNEQLNEDMEALLEAAELDEAQEQKVEREFSRQYHLITRDDRLERVAEDMVAHFVERGHRGKAMFVCIDKATAVKMYDKVRKHWGAYLKGLEAELGDADAARRAIVQDKIDYMRTTDMAVVVSPSQNEVADLRAKGVDIVPHRRRMVAEDLDRKFKDPDDPFRIVFVCAMWMTGFDVPCCSTIYLDKLMRNHTLMQTIARANRVFPEKVNGLIVDYAGVLRNLHRALAIYALPSGGDGQPIRDKKELVELLRQAVAEATAFCEARGVELQAIMEAEGFERVRLLDDAVEAMLVDDETKRQFRRLAENVTRLFKAIKPDPLVNAFVPVCTLLAVLSEKIRSTSGPADISAVMADVEKLLDRSIAAEGYVITADAPLDLSRIDVEALRKRFKTARKRTEIERLRGAIDRRLAMMVRLNRTRMDYVEKFQEMIDAYNAGSKNVEEIFEELIQFAQSLNEEEQRGVAEGLSEEELAMFDLLTRPDMRLTEKQERAVKKVARDLLALLKREKLVLDWRKRMQTRAAVRQCIEVALDTLPTAYTKEIYDRKCSAVFDHVFEAYHGAGRSIYEPAA